ncbi:amidohydrolase 3 [Favolaschia claudopus]|uniref:Amidohydrolase 3 n=1 Tax=Favolaschia claudopus TaxID=2862362 RepID=A0AAW0DXD9_9AGAR
MQLQLDGAKSVQDVIDRIKAYILAHPDVHADPSRWIQGMGWDQTKWPGAEFPTAVDLSRDPLLRGRPIVLFRIDVHASWVSERVLELMGPLPGDVEGGSIIRNAGGEPTGILVDNAMNLVPIPPWSSKQYTEYFDIAVAEALKFGLTSVHDAATDPAMVEFYKRQAESGELPIRLYLMATPFFENYTDWEPSRIKRLTNYGTHERLNLRSVKLFTDGALGSWGAALISPYSDKSDTRGIMRSSPETMNKLMRSAWRAKLQVNVHCIGDRANEAVLDIFENILAEEARSGNSDIAAFRPRIEHAQILQQSDLRRIGQLGVYSLRTGMARWIFFWSRGSRFALFASTSDMWYAETRLGPERIKGAYAYRTLLESSPKQILPLGSDFPVEGVNPLLGFYAAVTRLTADGRSPHGDSGWYPSERLTRTQALKGMTLDAAYASFAEHELGSLVAGKRADFVLFDRDIMEASPMDILKTTVIATVIDGCLRLLLYLPSASELRAMSNMKAYLAEKYMSGPKADAILAKVGPKKKKRKAAAAPSGFVVDVDGGWGDEAKEDMEDVEEAVVATDRSFKKRKVAPTEEGSGWATIQPGIKEESPAPDEQPQVVVEETAFVGGLVSAQQLRKALPQTNAEPTATAEEMALAQETVYRDATGRKINTKAARAEAARLKREREEKEAQKMEWGKGLVQRDEAEKRKQELEAQRGKKFARYADDADLNEEMKAKELWNDPAAQFLSKKRAKGPRRPEYTGPPPPPNRFGIKPGYRWDGVDRGNGFEKKWFQSINQRKRTGLESYQWSAEDM